MTILVRAKNWKTKGPNSNLPVNVRKAKEKASKRVRVVSKAKAHAPRRTE